MAELIERGPLLERLGEVTCGMDAFGQGVQLGVDYAMDVIRDALAVDAVEVVRCKDCKYWAPGKQCEKYSAYPHSVTLTLPEGYCHVGRRKDGGDRK